MPARTQHLSGAAERSILMAMEWVESKTALTRTGGFLREGFTHTLNPYLGCGFGGALCGVFCYAQHNHWVTRGRRWRLYAAKRNLCDAYCRDYDRWKSRARGAPRPLRIFMSSATDPYLPQEASCTLTRSLLVAMCGRPPDVLVLQTHSTLVERDLELIAVLSQRTELWLSVTVETDRERIAGFPAQAASPARRLETLREFRRAHVRTQAAVSPLLPLEDPHAFAFRLDEVCERVIIDHYLLGDGSGGLRTRQTDFEERLERAGYGAWTELGKMWEVHGIFCGILGENRVLVSREGFNAVGRGEGVGC